MDAIDILLCFLGAVALIVIIVLIRTLTFRPKHIAKKEFEDVYVNVDKAVSDLAEMVRCRTVSSHNKEEEEEAEFDKFKSLLPKLFPNIAEKCEFEAVGDRGLLYRCKGKSSDSPTVLMAHFDVVSVEESNWEKPPFDGIVENGVLWGRGTLDTKSTLNASMQALESLLSDGFIPKNDIYLAYAGVNASEQ